MPFNMAQNIFKHPNQFGEYQRYIFEQNQTIPDEIWPSFQEDAPWESYPVAYSKSLKDDRKIWLDSLPQSTKEAPSSFKMSPSQSNNSFHLDDIRSYLDDINWVDSMW